MDIHSSRLSTYYVYDLVRFSRSLRSRRSLCILSGRINVFFCSGSTAYHSAHDHCKKRNKCYQAGNFHVSLLLKRICGFFVMGTRIKPKLKLYFLNRSQSYIRPMLPGKQMPPRVQMPMFWQFPCLPNHTRCRAHMWQLDTACPRKRLYLCQIPQA